MSALIVCLSVLAYLATGIPAGRLVWARYRPNTEPVHCRHWVSCRDGKHDQQCYRWSPDSLIDKGEAVVLAITTALLWPLLVPFLAVGWAITRKPRFRREELEARIARMERELR